MLISAEDLMAGTQREVFYVSGAGGLMAVLLRENGQQTQLFFTLTDHPGSI